MLMHLAHLLRSSVRCSDLISTDPISVISVMAIIIQLEMTMNIRKVSTSEMIVIPA
jgi:hypothetical protein